jgi:uncharacterized protein YfaS (alpha-2-macroglobulin family)
MRYFFCLLIAVLTSLSMNARADNIAERRQEAKKLMDDGNWKEALEVLQAILPLAEHRGEPLAEDLRHAVTCVQQLNRWEAWDAVVEETVAAHGVDWQLLAAAASLYGGTQSWGTVVSGEFRRGQRAGGKFVNSGARDRVRSLQLMAQALPLLGAGEVSPAQRADFFGAFASQMLAEEGWALQSLTDLAKLPDYEEMQRGRGRFGMPGRSGRGAPVDEKGDPVLHRVPESWEKAVSDGERMRWLLGEMARQSPVAAVRADEILAGFLASQFDVRTMADSWRPAGDDDEARRSGILALHTLKDNETVARLATGVKRFTLPAEFSYVEITDRIFRNPVDAGLAVSATGTMAGFLLDRRQYDRAASIFRNAIDRLGGSAGEDQVKSWQAQHDQIVKPWGRFDGSQMRPAGTGAKLGYVFRNGGKVALTARAVKVRELLDDTRKWLADNPADLDWGRLDIGSIGYRIAEENMKKYLGAEVAKWEVPLEPRPQHWDRRTEITTPLQTPGAYFVEAVIEGGNRVGCIVWLTDTAIVHKQGIDEQQYYVTDAVSGTPVGKATLDFFGYRVEPLEKAGRRQFNVQTRRFAEFTDESGQFFGKADQFGKDMQWLVTATTPDGRFAHFGFSAVWFAGKDQQEWNQRKIITVTDRPVYRPGQTVHWKAWARLVRYDEPEDRSQYGGAKFTVALLNPRGETVFEKEMTADALGGMGESFVLDAAAGLGVYRLQCRHPDGFEQDGSFRVEEYRKPEFEVKVDAPAEPVALGDKVEATVSAAYFFGAPVTEATVKYKVLRSAHDSRWYPVRPWDWFYGSGYWWFGYDYDWYPGFRTWGCRPPLWWWWPQQQDPPEVVMESEGRIGPDGKLKVVIDTATANELHGDEDHRYEISIEVTDASRRTILGNGQILVARQPFSVVAWTDRGHYETGQPIEVGVRAFSIDQKGVKGTGRVALLKLSYDEKGEPQEREVAARDVMTSDDGSVSVRFSASEAGQYRVAAKVSDARGRTQEGGVFLVVRGGGHDGRNYRFAALEIVPEKPEYAPGEEVKFLVNSEREGSTVYLFIRPSAGIAPRPQVLRLDGKSTELSFRIETGDMPNVFLEAFSVRDGVVHSAMREIAVPPAKRLLQMEVKPEADRYQPRGRAKLQVTLRDSDGRPFRGVSVLTVYDKALEYISGGSNVPKIGEYFWKWRRQHHSAADSSLGTAFPSLNLPPDQPGWQPLGIFGGDDAIVLGGGMIPRGGVANRFSRAGGGPVVMADGMAEFGTAAPMTAAVMDAVPEAKFSADFRAGKLKAMPGKPGSAAAGGGEDAAAPVMIRSEFADSAYWTSQIETDADGKAVVEVPLPDNLTTWKVRSWAMAHGTRVGEAETEFVTGKDLLLRLQSPRFFTEKDEVTLSANVHSYLAAAKDVTVSLELDGDAIALMPGAEPQQMVRLEPGREVRIDWRVRAQREGKAVVRMKAVTDGASDAVEQSFPVHVHGLLKTESWSAAIRPEGTEAKIAFTVPEARRPDQSRLEVRYSPSLATAMVDALPYLVDYPYGCTEQTLNRFVPAVIARKALTDLGIDLAAVKEKRTNLNAQQIGDPQQRAAQWKDQRWAERHPVFDDREHSLIAKTGLERITSMQNRDGGWGWFSGEREQSWPHTTAMVVHGLQQAQAVGMAIVPGTMDRGVAWLKAHEEKEAGRMQRWKEKNPPDDAKKEADATDALVRMVLAEAGVRSDAMAGFLYRDRNALPVYAKVLTALAMDTEKQTERRDMLIRNIEQFLVRDDENQSARLDLRNGSFWWWWYGSDIEANAFYLKLLARVKPKSADAAGVVKYLLNNRRNATWWTSTRDTAFCIEAMAAYLKATGENAPDMTINILVDGQPKKSVRITKENLFSFDASFVMSGPDITAGKHEVTIQRSGSGPVYANVYATNFSLEDRISRAGLEVKVDRAYFKLVERKDATALVSGSRGQVLNQKVVKYDRLPLKDGDALKSGELVEVELTLESKNDYEYLVFEDRKPAGCEPDDVRSGYSWEGLGAYREFRDDRVAFFVRSLPLGKHNLSYRFRAETPGKFSALPATGLGMYAPELRANSDEMKIGIAD